MITMKWYAVSFNSIQIHYYFSLCSLLAELDALEADMGMETEADGVPSYLQPDREPALDDELNLPSAPIGQAAVPAGRPNAQVKSIDFFGKNWCSILEFLLNWRKLWEWKPLI